MEKINLKIKSKVISESLNLNLKQSHIYMIALKKMLKKLLCHCGFEDSLKRILGMTVHIYWLMGGEIDSRDDLYYRRLIYYKMWGAPIFNLVMIQTTSICNRKCCFCYYGIEKEVRPIIMNDDTFKKIIDDLVKIKYSGKLALFEINEPFTDKKILERIDYAVEKLPDAWHHFVTNGDLATEEKLLWIADKVNRLDINSYDKEAHKRNLKFVEILRKNSNKAKITHSDHVNTCHTYTSRGGHIKAYYKYQGNEPFCEYVHQVLMITPLGEVVSCWNDFYQINKFGNVNNQSIMDIWFSKKFNAFRKYLSKGNRNISTLCKQCDYKGYNEWCYADIKYKEDGTTLEIPRVHVFRYPSIKKYKWLFYIMSLKDKKLKND